MVLIINNTPSPEIWGRYNTQKDMNLNFPTKRINPLIDYFLSHAISKNVPNSMKLGNYDSDYDDEDGSYDPDEDLDMMFDDEEFEEMHEAY